MKRILASFIISIVSVSASAQYVSDAWDTFYPSERGKVDFFVRVGGNLAKSLDHDDDIFTGVTGGIGLNVFLSPEVSIQSGLFYIAKGTYFRPKFIECPVMVTCNSQSSAGIQWQAAFGSFLAYNIGDYDYYDFERYDYGLAISGGIFLWDGVLLGLNYELGLDKDYYYCYYCGDTGRTNSLSLVLDFYF